MKSRKVRRITLARETLRWLDGIQPGEVGGGIPPSKNSCEPGCPTVTYFCCVTNTTIVCC